MYFFIMIKDVSFYPLVVAFRCWSVLKVVHALLGFNLTHHVHRGRAGWYFNWRGGSYSTTSKRIHGGFFQKRAASRHGYWRWGAPCSLIIVCGCTSTLAILLLALTYNWLYWIHTVLTNLVNNWFFLIGISRSFKLENKKLTIKKQGDQKTFS